MPISKHEETMVNLRVQMQQNQSELQDYLADLDNWEKDIKQKEEHLKVVKTTTKSQDLPPVRNTIEKKKMKKKKKEQKGVDSRKPKRISGSDFKAWDKFDVDKALEEVDKTEEKTSSSEYETDEEWEMERKKHLASVEKDKGNEFLKRGDYDNAVEAYTKGMNYDATNAILPANRALALLKQQKYAAAELDCTVSISLDPLYVKAYLRRATARAGLGKFDEAVADYGRVVDLEPSNKQAKAEVERLQTELKREKEEPVASTLTEEGKGIVKPVYKQPEERSKVPLKRIIIEEIGIEQSDKRPVNTGHSDTAKKITALEEDNFQKLVTPQRILEQTAPTLSADTLQPLSETLPLQSVSRASRNLEDEQRESNNSNNLIESRVEHQDFSKFSIPSNVLKAQKRPSWNAASNVDDSLNKSSKSDQNQRNSASNNAGEGVTIPQTSFQFQSDFRLLQHQPEAFFQYFQAIPPDQYPKLFGQCLDADMLMVILKTLAANYDRCAHDLYEILHQLSQVKRFSMMAMFLSQKDKQVVRVLLEQLSKSGARPQNDILSLSLKYEL